MLNYSQFILEKNEHFLILDEESELLEKLLTFGGSRPRYDNVVIMIGGAASGKGFVLQNLVGIEGRVFDVDALKTLSMKSELIKNKILTDTGVDISTLNLKNPDDVAFLHQNISDLGIHDKRINTQLASIVGGKNKPNLIFDVTMTSLRKLEDISYRVTRLGYKKENIHIVWVVNDIDTAIEQNNSRDRSVPIDILKSTHSGVANNVKNILNSYYSIEDYMDGDFYIVFNKKGIDTFLKISGSGGSYIKDALSLKIKERGNKVKHISELDDEIIKKLEKYTRIKFK